MSWELCLAKLHPQELACLALKGPPKTWKTHPSSLLYEDGCGAEVNPTQPCWCGRRGSRRSGKEGLERARAMEEKSWALKLWDRVSRWSRLTCFPSQPLCTSGCQISCCAPAKSCGIHPLPLDMTTLLKETKQFQDIV